MITVERRAVEKSDKNDRQSARAKREARPLKKHLKYLIPQYRLVLVKEPGVTPKSISSPGDIEQFIEPLKHYAEEHFVAFHLNAKFEVIGHQIVSHGTLSASLVHPREVFKAALLSNSYALIVAHNHPAGSLTPSSEDIETTKTLIRAGKLLGVSVVDHIIVSSNGHRSIRESRPEFWSD